MTPDILREFLKLVFVMVCIFEASIALDLLYIKCRKDG